MIWGFNNYMQRKVINVLKSINMKIIIIKWLTIGKFWVKDRGGDGNDCFRSIQGRILQSSWMWEWTKQRCASQ